MPRTARKKSESGICHVMLRGINWQPVFQDDEDYLKYLQCLEDCKGLSGFTLHGYCLMGNHIHLLIEEGAEALNQVFKRIGVRYVYWYNRKYNRTGPLFEDRFKSEAVEDDSYFLTVLRYIYQNPVKAQLCKRACDYTWSSYASLEAGSKLADHSKALGLLSFDELAAFLNKPSEEDCLDIETKARLSDPEVIDLIKHICKLTSVTDFAFLAEEKQIVYLHKLHDGRCSIRGLARLLGLSKAQIEKLLKK